MIDTDGSTDGVYSIENNTVTLRFGEGSGTPVYTGTISGSEMTGTATNGKKTWNFSLVKR
ncbi:MAG: hypothetical protein FJ303_00380 [Planctomycetes bacterium]|nr:hypothetical protein [Planctomycetota bacterium]